MKHLFKVLDKDMRPPIQGGDPVEIGEWYHCDNFCEDISRDCAPGFYGIPVSQLIQYFKPWEGHKLTTAKYKGKSVVFSEGKQRYEYQCIKKVLTDVEIKALCRKAEPELGYKLYEALYPLNPLKMPKVEVTEKDIQTLKAWDSIRASVRASVWDSIWASIRASIRASVWDSVRDSVWVSVGVSVGVSVWETVWDSAMESVWAYMGSLFPNVGKWEYMEHEHGIYPFQPAVDLWYRGMVPSFDGKLWRLHSGENADVVWTEPSEGWLKNQEESND